MNEQELRELKMYRYKQSFGELYLLEYEVIRTTHAGKWINSTNMFPVKDYCGEKFVKNTGKKRFAYETKEAALLNFIRRTERHIILTNCNLKSAEEALGKANVLIEKPIDSEGGDAKREIRLPG